MPTLQVAGRVPLAGFYALYFGTTGIVLPFLPAYLRGLDLSPTQVGLLLSLSPVLSLVAPPWWGQLADRTGRPDRVLTVLGVGALCGFALLLRAERFATVAGALAVYAVFATSVTALADSLTLHRVAHVGGSYAHLRLFGSLGFVASSSLFGLLTEGPGRATVLAPLGLIAGYTVWSLTLRSQAHPAPPSSPFAGFALLRDGALARLLLAAGLHWVACAPFHGMLSIHVQALGLRPFVVGAASALGVAAEVAVMLLYPRLAARVTVRHLLLVAYGGSALRWAGMAVATSAPAIIALSLLHGLTFGAFYIACVAWVAERVPAALRARGQGLFAAVTFGLGGLVGYAGAGAGYDALGGHRLFAVAAVLEVACLLLVRRLAPARPAAAAVPAA